MIDSDWLVMRQMAVVVREMAGRVARPADVAIDYGCGSMPYRPVFVEAGCTYLGADFAGQAEIGIDDSGRLGVGDARADLLLSFQVLEHVRDLDAYFGEIERVLRADGLLLLSTHGVWLYHPHPEDHRRWTREGLVSEIESHGFQVAECVAVVGPLAWTTILRLTCWCFALKRIPLVGKALAQALSVIMNARAIVEELLTPAWVKADNACVYVTLSKRRNASRPC